MTHVDDLFPEVVRAETRSAAQIVELLLELAPFLGLVPYFLLLHILRES